MRLVCPNCGAEYAIDSRIIPEQGRDVQCSACGHTWFQGRDSLTEADAGAELAPATPPPPQSSPSARRDVDPEVMAVLKAEAERERRARAAELAALEVQPDLDLPQPHDTGRGIEPRAPSDTSQPVDRVEEDAALRPAPRPPANTTRGDLLPDIEEINSTLEPTAQQTEQTGRSRPEPPSVRIARMRRGQGRRYGFALACFVFGAAALVYAKGPQIGQAVPAFAPMLDAYVEGVQDGRLWLDSVMRRAGSLGTSAANING